MKTTIKNNPAIKRLLIGAATGIIFCLLSTLITAFILTKNDLSFNTVKYLCFAVIAASCSLAGFIGKKNNKMKGIVCGAITSLLVVFFVVLIVLLVNRFKTGEDVFLLVPAGLSFGILGGIISSNLR